MPLSRELNSITRTIRLPVDISDALYSAISSSNVSFNFELRMKAYAEAYREKQRRIIVSDEAFKYRDHSNVLAITR